MKVLLEKNKIIFENDAEFYNWAIIPKLITKQCGSIFYTDVEYTYDYLDKTRRGFSFIIADKNSQIFKHKSISYRTVTKSIKNLKPYYGSKFL